MAVCKEFGLIEDKGLASEELGDKALQAQEQGITPEKFEKYQEYVREIEKFQLDPEKSKAFTLEEKLAKATELNAAVLAESYGKFLNIGDVILQFTSFPEYLTDRRLKTYLELAAVNPEYKSLFGHISAI